MLYSWLYRVNESHQESCINLFHERDSLILWSYGDTTGF